MFISDTIVRMTVINYKALHINKNSPKTLQPADTITMPKER